MTYDDFESGNVNNWTVIENVGGPLAAAGAAARFGSYGARFTTDGSNDSALSRSRNTAASDATGNYYTYIRVSNIAGDVTYDMRDSVADTIMAFRITASKIKYQETGGAWQDFTEVPSANTWYRLRATYNGTLVDYRLYDTNNNIIESHLGVTPNKTGTIDRVEIKMLDNSASTETIDWDNTAYTNTTDPAPPATGGFMQARKFWT